MSLALPPPDRGHARLHRARSSRKRPEIAEANVDARSRPATRYGETSEDFAVSYEIAPAHARAGHVPPDHRQHGARATGSSPPRVRAGAAALPRRLPDHAGVVDPRGARAATSTSASAPSRPRTRSPPSGAALGAAFGGALGVTDLGRPGHRAQERDDRARRSTLELPLADPRHPARRPLDGHADEARAGRPADGRSSGATASAPVPVRRGLDAVAVLRRRDRGGADRAQVPHARLPALRRLPRERLRAVADPGRRVAAGHLDRVRDGAERRRRLPAVPARPEHARPAVGDPRHARARAPDRRPREGRTSPATSPTTRTTTT